MMLLEVDASLVKAGWLPLAEVREQQRAATGTTAAGARAAASGTPTAIDAKG